MLMQVQLSEEAGATIADLMDNLGFHPYAPPDTTSEAAAEAEQLASWGAI